MRVKKARRRRTFASFRLTGDDLDPEELIERTEITPHYAAKDGEILHSRRHRRPRALQERDGFVWKRPNMWSVSSREIFDTETSDVGDLNQHLLLLLELLEPHSDMIREHVQRPGVRAEFFCFWSYYSSHGPTIPPSTLVRMGALGAAFSLDIYSLD